MMSACAIYCRYSSEQQRDSMSIEARHPLPPSGYISMKEHDETETL